MVFRIKFCFYMVVVNDQDMIIIYGGNDDLSRVYFSRQYMCLLWMSPYEIS